MKLRISIKCRYDWRRIRNGEKIIVDKGSAEPIVELVDGDIEGESKWVKLNRFFDELERGPRRGTRIRQCGRKVRILPFFGLSTVGAKCDPAQFRREIQRNLRRVIIF